MNNLSTKYNDYQFRNIFLVQDRNFWMDCPFAYNPKTDLVLTLDFGLYREIKANGGIVDFIDHIVDQKIMQKYNFETYDFFNKWYLDKDGKDIFTYKNISFGKAFRQELWNILTYYARTWICIDYIQKIYFSTLYVGLEDERYLQCLEKQSSKYQRWLNQKTHDYKVYAFPTFKWMQEQINPKPKTIRQKIKRTIQILIDYALIAFEKLKVLPKKDCIIIQEYYPTRPIVDHFKMFDKYTIIKDDCGVDLKYLFGVRRVPQKKCESRHVKQAQKLVAQFMEKKCIKWTIENNPIEDILINAFLEKIQISLPSYIEFIETSQVFFKGRNIKLMVLIANIGMKNEIMHSYCKLNNIPSFLIINGYLTGAYLDEGKDASWINSYGKSIKNSYFKGMNNIVCLGDPRMDEYVGSLNKKQKSLPSKTIIGIGAAGYNTIDLNSYIAFEFDFLFDILSGIAVCQKSKKIDIILKVRANGYASQYESFINEYFPGLGIQIIASGSMHSLLDKIDLYISFYSQTIMEAAALGIPTIYYKKDNEIMDPPFDGKSELVTVNTVDAFVKALGDFHNVSSRYDGFLKKEVLENYVGPLDGLSVQRNLAFIHDLIENKVYANN